MKWVVLEENPKQGDYIAVVLTETKKLKIESQAHAIYNDGDDALASARE